MKRNLVFCTFLLAAAAVASPQAYAKCQGKVVRDDCDNPYCCPKDFAGTDPDPAVCTPPRGGPVNCHGGAAGSRPADAGGEAEAKEL